MTTTVTKVSTVTILSNSYAAMSSNVGLVAIALLMLVLLEKELVRTRYAVAPHARLRIFDIAIVPLLVVCGKIFIIRFIDLLP